VSVRFSVGRGDSCPSASVPRNPSRVSATSRQLLLATSSERDASPYLERGIREGQLLYIPLDLLESPLLTLSPLKVTLSFRERR
jgi:hypothetical protein